MTKTKKNEYNLIERRGFKVCTLDSSNPSPLFLDSELDLGVFSIRMVSSSSLRGFFGDRRDSDSLCLSILKSKWEREMRDCREANVCIYSFFFLWIFMGANEKKKIQLFFIFHFFFLFFFRSLSLSLCLALLSFSIFFLINSGY